MSPLSRETPSALEHVLSSVVPSASCRLRDCTKYWHPTIKYSSTYCTSYCMPYTSGPITRGLAPRSSWSDCGIPVQRLPRPATTSTTNHHQHFPIISASEAARAKTHHPPNPTQPSRPDLPCSSVSCQGHIGSSGPFSPWFLKMSTLQRTPLVRVD